MTWQWSCEEKAGKSLWPDSPAAVPKTSWGLTWRGTHSYVGTAAQWVSSTHHTDQSVALSHEKGVSLRVGGAGAGKEVLTPGQESPSAVGPEPEIFLWRILFIYFLPPPFGD